MLNTLNQSNSDITKTYSKYSGGHLNEQYNIARKMQSTYLIIIFKLSLLPIAST